LGPLILAGFAGAVIFLLLISTFTYRGRVLEAEFKRDEAVNMCADALEAKKNAEDGFVKAKAFFDERLKLPVAALMTDEQIDRIAEYLASKLFLSNVRSSELKQ